MRLRNLIDRDASLMYEWMKSSLVTENMHIDYGKLEFSAVREYIKTSEWMIDEKNLAIVNDEDEYMGTASLKNIDQKRGLAEFAIVVRECAMGKGYAWYGMLEMLKIAFDKYGLEKVYWHVKKTNTRAIHFFAKHGFNMLDEDIPHDLLNKYDNEQNLVWFVVLKGDDFQNEALSRGKVANCKIIRIKTIPTIEAGELSFFEANKDIGFDIKRIYYISKVPEGTRRGFHAHRELKQLLFCPYGKIQLVLENENEREEITLSDPSIGVVIEKPTWREMLWMEKNSVLVVAASDFYNPKDYIRDYNEFKEYIASK